MIWHSVSVREASAELKTDIINGLSSDQAEKRILEYGANIIEAKSGKSLPVRFLLQFKDFMILILLAAAAVSFVISYMSGEPDFADPVIILAIVIINAVIGLVQESRAEKAISALKAMAAPKAHVLRGGKAETLDSSKVTRGDILLLEAGDYVTADARIVESIGLMAEESSLTGESLPVEKHAEVILPSSAVPGERINMLFSGSLITSGRGKAIVCGTGMDTEVGKIASMISEHESPDTPLQKRLSEIGRTLGISVLIICAGIFIMGVLQKSDIIDSFLIAVSLAVAAIPEGLPAVVTIVLALGVQRMAAKNAIIRKLPAVETLGAATVICSDKTGTLTQNRMTVVTLADSQGEYPPGDGAAKKVLILAALCTNCNVNNSGEVSGEPTEAALVNAAQKSIGSASQTAYSIKRIQTEYPRIGEVPFSSGRKRMSTVHKLPGGGVRVIVKGAPDMLLPLCVSLDDRGGLRDINRSQRQNLLAIAAAMGDRALRVLAVAYKDLSEKPVSFNSGELEKGLIFTGFACMVDPPRPEAMNAVALCKKAGITPVMITGDHKNTAAAIARELGIQGHSGTVFTGTEIENMGERELSKAVTQAQVFARVTPEHKSRIVRAYQSLGEVVAMTGDGVNDAPALKIADIGCAMGISGTDVARGAADMILADDNFATIVEAVREGRGIYQNIRRSVHYLLSCNIGEILVIFAAFMLRLPSPLLPIQLLWVNLVTDSLPALALGVEPISQDVMSKNPLSPKKGLFADGLGAAIGFQGLLIGALTFLAFMLGVRLYDAPGQVVIGRTMTFAGLSLSQLVHAFNVRSETSVFKLGLFSNRALVWAFVICAILQMSVIMLPATAALFNVVPLNLRQLGIVVTLSLTPLAAVEINKLLAPALGKKNSLQRN